MNSNLTLNHGLEQQDFSKIVSMENLIQLKIVYWGPGESGKTTNFFRLREKFHSFKLTRGFSIETADGRTLWQDSVFLSFKFSIKKVVYQVIVQVVTCTGQERFLPTREYMLDGADGIVFVADSNPEKMEQNRRSFRELIGFTSSREIPHVIQVNKRDLENAISIKALKTNLGLPKEEKYQDGTFVVYPAKALEGKNMMACFQDLVLQVIFNYFKK